MISMRTPMAAQKAAADLLLPVRGAVDRARRPERGEQFAVNVALDRLGRHLHGDDRHGRHPGTPVEARGMIAQEFADDFCLAHARVAIEQQTRHAIARRIGRGDPQGGRAPLRDCSKSSQRSARIQAMRSSSGRAAAAPIGRQQMGV